MVREKSGTSQGILLYSNCGHPVTVNKVLYNLLQPRGHMT